MARNARIVKHRRKRIVEVVQQSTPLLVLGGLTKTDFVVLYRLPAHEQHVLTWALKAAL